MYIASIVCFAALAVGFNKAPTVQESRRVADSCVKPLPWSTPLVCQATEPKQTRQKAPARKSSTVSRIPEWDAPSHCDGTYCVYSNRQLGGGIVLVTTKENADKLARLQGFDSTEQTGSNDSTPFFVTSVPGKGMGLVTNRTIKRGERIMIRTPTLMVHRKLMDDIEPMGATLRMLDAAVMKLPAQRRRAYMRQMGQFGGHKIVDILHTNSFQMDLETEDGHHYGNFPEISRFNHECRPK